MERRKLIAAGLILIGAIMLLVPGGVGNLVDQRPKHIVSCAITLDRVATDEPTIGTTSCTRTTDSCGIFDVLAITWGGWNGNLVFETSDAKTSKAVEVGVGLPVQSDTHELRSCVLDEVGQGTVKLYGLPDGQLIRTKVVTIM